MAQSDTKRSFTGPLSGLKVVEIGSIGPGPFCAMLLADLGADVVRIDRATGAGLVGPNADFRTELLHRGRRSLAVDLKHPDGAEVVLSLVADADVLLEGFRSGVTERLGIGPDDCDRRPPSPGEHTTEILSDWGIDLDRTDRWLRSGAVRHAPVEA